jgi:aminoglycoside phosphotransferase (APT) family kinase protein
MDAQGLGNGPIANVTPLKDGTQNVLIRFTRAGQSYVLRRPPEKPRSNSNETMRREARMLSALAKTNVPHPPLVASCDAEDVLGVSFYLMREIEGFNIGNGMPDLHAGSPQLRREMGMNLVDAIARLGRLDYMALGLKGFGRPDNYLERQVGRWRKQLDSYRELAWFWLVSSSASSWRERTRELAQGRRHKRPVTPCTPRPSRCFTEHPTSSSGHGRNEEPWGEQL